MSRRVPPPGSADTGRGPCCPPDWAPGSAQEWIVNVTMRDPKYPPGACEHVRAEIDAERNHWRRVRLLGEL